MAERHGTGPASPAGRRSTAGRLGTAGRRRAERRAIAAVLASGRFGSEDAAYALEDVLGAAFGCGAAVTSSGSGSIELALMAAGIGPGSEVLVPALTCSSVPDAVRAVGADPVAVDVHPDTGTMDAGAIGSAVTGRTAAAVVVDLFGCWRDSRHTLETVLAHGLFGVHDTATSFGADRTSPPPGSVQIASFHPSKVLAAGEGGVVLSGDAVLLERIRHLRSPGALAVRLGRTPPDPDERPGRSLRMSDLDAALAAVRFGSVGAVLAARRDVAAQWQARLAPLGNRLGLPSPGGHAFATYPVRLPDDVDRNAVLARLRDAGVPAGSGYPALITTTPEGERTRASHLGASLVTLVTHPGVKGVRPTDAMLDAGAAVLGAALGAVVGPAAHPR
jgi:perosamine synthetase